MPKTLVLFVFVALSIVGCAQIKVIPVAADDKPNLRGVRFYEPRPYLLITAAKQAAGGDASPNVTTPTKNRNTTTTVDKAAGVPGTVTGDGEHTTEVRTTPAASTPLYALDIIYLPDYSKGYRAEYCPGLGSFEGGIRLASGWQLTEYNLKADTQIPQTLNAVAGLIKDVGTLGALSAQGGSGALQPGLYNMSFDKTGVLIRITRVEISQ